MVWNSEAPMKLLEGMPARLNQANLERLQQVIDIDKYANSSELGRDLCGEYAPFCFLCDKSLHCPCAVAYVKMRQHEGADIVIDASAETEAAKPEEPKKYFRIAKAIRKKKDGEEPAVEAAPAEEPVADEAPVEEAAPAEEPVADEAVADEAPAEDAAAEDEAPESVVIEVVEVEEAPAEDAAADEAPADDAAADEAPVEEIVVEVVEAEDNGVEEIAVEVVDVDIPAEDAPAEDDPAEDAAAEDEAPKAEE